MGFAAVDEAGFVTLPRVRAKSPVGRYSLLSKNGEGVAVNLEYLIQIGAAAELALDHGWPADALDFERGEFDVLGYRDGRVVLAVEAKARVEGSDGLTRLLRAWDSYDPRTSPVPDKNAGRKYKELLRLAGDGPVVLWLVASGARWTFLAEHDAEGLTLMPLDGGPTYDRAVS